MTKYIDVQHHLLPPFYYDALNSADIPKKYNITLPTRSVESSKKLMDRFNIESAITSIFTQGVYIGGTKFSNELARPAGTTPYSTGRIDLYETLAQTLKGKTSKISVDSDYPFVAEK